MVTVFSCNHILYLFQAIQKLVINTVFRCVFSIWNLLEYALRMRIIINITGLILQEQSICTFMTDPPWHSVIAIKSMIDCDGATCRNNNHFECPTVLNAPWDDHSVMFFKSVADLCFTGPFAVLGKVKYQYRPLRASRKTVQVWERWRTDVTERMGYGG